MNEQMRMNLDGARDRCAKLAAAAVEAIEFFNDIEKELKENRGDCKEPLIKDEKVRKAVRAWAEASGINQQEIKASIGTRCTEFIGWRKDETHGIGIEFRNPAGIENIADGEPYTIEELCGEDERNAGVIKRYGPGMPQRVIFERMKQDLGEWIEKNDIRSIQTYVHTEPDGRRGVQFVDKTNAGHNRLTIIGWPTIGLVDGASYTPEELLTTREEAK